MAFKMKGSPFNMGTVKGTTGHASALKQTEYPEPKKGKRPGYSGEVSDLTSEQLNNLPADFFDNPHDLGPGGNEKVIGNLNRDKYRAWLSGEKSESPE